MGGGRARLTVCEWLDDDSFRTLLKVYNYVGRAGGCSVFELDEGKLARAYDDIDDVLELVKRYAEDPVGASRQLLEALGNLKVVELRALDSGFLLTSRLKIGEVLSQLKAADPRGCVYSREHGGYVVKPYLVLDAVKLLEAEGFRVVDASGMLECSEVEGELKVDLRPYQEEALSRWLERRRGVIVLPTGSGKTVVGIAAILRTRCPTLVVTYTKEQMMQWYEKLRELTNIPPGSLGLFYGERKQLSPVTVSTYQSAVRYVGELARRFKLLIVDEAHHLPAQKFRIIAQRVLAPYRMGLSATPYREDGLHDELFKLMGGVVYERSARELAEEGYIASFVVDVVRVKMRPEERQLYRKLVEELSRYPNLRDAAALLELDPSLVGKAYRTISALRRLLTTMDSKLEAVRDLVKRELARGSKVIVFVDYVDAAERLARMLGALLLTGRMSEEARLAALRAFKARRPAVLVTTTVGDEGLDVVDADVGVVLSSLISRRQFVQRLGRLLRPSEGKVARLYVVVAQGTFEERRLRAKLLQELSSGWGLP